jgi:excisionase family DNA binding protein
VLLSIKQAAEALGVCPRTLYNLRKRRKIPFVQLGRRVLFPKAELERWIREQAERKWR